MESIYIDSALLSVPNYAVDDSTAQELIERVSEFSLLSLPDVPVTIVIARDVEALLWGMNCGPDYEVIEQFIELMGIGHLYSARDVFQQYLNILQFSTRSDSAAPFEIAAVTGFSAVPPLPPNLYPAALGAETERTFTTVAILDQQFEAWSLGSALSGFDALHTIAASAERITGPQPQAAGDVPLAVVGKVRSIRSLRDMASWDVAFRYWRLGVTSEDLHFAITLCALLLARESDAAAKFTSLKKFRIGPDFIASLVATQGLGEGRFASVLRTICSQIIAGLCQRAIRPFGRPEQEVRSFDQALGWRVHLTEGNEGLRLMFWETVDGEVEFANVGVKRELIIAHGRKGGACKVDLCGLLS